MKKLLTKIKQSSLIKSGYKITFILLGMLPKKKNVIVFESFLGKQYSCNPRAIYEYIQRNKKEMDCYWSYDPRYEEQFKEYNLKQIKRFSIQWLFVLSRAQYWVSNSRLPLWIPKPKNTVYLQTWHGTPLKKLGVDMEEVHMPGTTTENYKRNFTMESCRWDYLISPNEYSTEIFQRAFRFHKNMIESGYPRNDFLYNHTQEDVTGIRTKLRIPADKKVILYAPTWRDNEYHSVGKYKFSLHLDLKKLKEELGNEYVILLRLHYLIAENIDLTPFENFAMDVSNHSDIRELYVISDLLITDYSSVYFDYANLNRPILFFVYDIEHYRDRLRGFYVNFEEEAPGPLVKETSELIEEIKKISQSDSFSLPVDFTDKFTYLEDGQASKRVVETVFK
ncbi:CDP-glycerol glycerophosphotransferase [Evansella vedderi]|uniref:CDP-glycerol glycerophosphotransferase n=1 Tax=Evansella vedderi TaxID=38282 RepID=A0ABT9ZUW4_9BACI|nr:CDP-glycerol glycerophosphotransferase [Evansella vedderi]